MQSLRGYSGGFMKSSKIPPALLDPLATPLGTIMRCRGWLMMNSRWILAVKAAVGPGYAATTSIFLVLLSSKPSYAIPSPDLVVGSLSSISQLIAIVSAMIGGGAAVVGVRATANSSSASNAARIAWCIVGVATVILGLSLTENYYQYSTQRSERLARLESAILRSTEMSDGHTLDPNLKEVSYDDQLHASRGISTDRLNDC